MDVSKLKRNKNVIQAIFKETNKKSLVALKKCSISIPVHYVDSNLASIGDTISILGIFAIVVDDKFYAVSNVNAMITIEPSTINTVTIGDTEYYEFIFEKGDTFITNLDLVKRDTLVYRIFDEFVAKGNTPWYMSYLDIGKLFDTSRLHGGANLNSNHAIFEMITASRARLEKDRTMFYRHTFLNSKQLNSNPPANIPLKNVQFGASNTTAKLMGAYFDEGLSSALVTPSQRTEKIEDILRR